MSWSPSFSLIHAFIIGWHDVVIKYDAMLMFVNKRILYVANNDFKAYYAYMLYKSR
jgi:hypothetical protein